MKSIHILSFSFLVAFTASVFAGTPVQGGSSGPTEVSGRAIPLDLFSVGVTQTFQSDFKEGHGFDPEEKSNNNTNTWRFEIQYSHRVALDAHWYLRLGLDATRYDFGNNRSLAPNTLQSYAGVVALEYFTDSGECGFFVQAKPGIYIAHDLNAGAVDVPTNVVLIYPLLTRKFYLVGGVTVGILRQYPVLPIAGVLWHLNDRWDLRAYLPEPKLVYKASDKLELWGGGEFVGGAFRNDSRSDREAVRLNGTPVEYYEIRGGGGLRYAVSSHVNIDAAAGWAFVRKFDFYRADITQETEGAPYARLAATVDF